MFYYSLSGVQFDVRKLQLGDFLWVARERTVPTPGIEVFPVHLYFAKINDLLKMYVNPLSYLERLVLHENFSIS